MPAKTTPLMQQYWGIKDQHPDKILFFRMGDFYEMFADDAQLAAPILGIALTVRNKKAGDETKMCGMPHHSISGSVSKLLNAGHKVAICDQLEDPKLAKGLVKRGVTRVLTPGMVYDPETLDELSANFLCAYDEHFVSFLDVSTGRAFSYSLSVPAEREEFIRLLQPVEFVLSSAQKRSRMVSGELVSGVLSSFEEVDQVFQGAESERRLVAYVKSLQGDQAVSGLRAFERRKTQKTMKVSATTLRHLEVFQTYKGEAEGSLFWAIHRTKTSSGARLLKSYLQFPLTDLDEIRSRQERVQFWKSNYGRLRRFRNDLVGVGDLERRLSKLSQPNGNARDLLNLAHSLDSGLEATRQAGLSLPELASSLVQVRLLATDIFQTITEEPGLSVRDGGMIRDGVNSQLDEWIQLTKDSQGLLLEMEAREKEKTGIPSLKIRFNNVFGFYIEVTKAHTQKVPGHYVRKQTLTNAERYITDELQKLEDKILSAKSKRNDLEFQLFEELKGRVLNCSVDILAVAKGWSQLDVASSLAWLSLEFKYCRPQFSKVRALQLSSSRHPVVEQSLKKKFVPNDIQLDPSGCLLLTGPNMAGKSTIMRQVALTSLLAQAGSDVPASSAVLPLFDQVFTRIGASDHLSEGLSTFMVEMTETAALINASTSHSLVVLDEIGRGTSTYDGMSLAQSILEYLVTNKKCMTLFATHYHELVSMSERFDRIRNAHMSIAEFSGERMDFLHQLKPGPALKSYGIGVARLAGLPSSLLQRAELLMKTHEAKNAKSQFGFEEFLLYSEQGSGSDSQADSRDSVNEVLNQKERAFLDQLRNLKLPEMTPLDAINTIAEWQKDLS